MGEKGFVDLGNLNCVANDYGDGDAHSICFMWNFAGGDVLAAVKCGTVPQSPLLVSATLPN